MLSVIYFTIFLTFWKITGHQGSRSDVRRVKEDAVELTIYYECLCPYSRRFITNQLWPTYQKCASILEIELIPYGLAQVWHTREANHEYEFSCQHGPDECKGNMIQACALDLYPDIGDNLPFISCLMEVKNQLQTGRHCASESNLDWHEIKSCSYGQEGENLLHHMGVKTSRLNPKLYIVPWILVNGQADREMRHVALHNLLELVCSSYEGQSPPSACNK